MTVLMVQYTVREDSVTDVEGGIEKVMTAIDHERPEGVRYAMFKRPDGVTFVGILELAEGVENPLPGIPTARELQQNLAGWVAGGPPTPEPLEVVGAYRFFS